MKRTIYYLTIYVVICAMFITFSSCVGGRDNCKLTQGISGYGPGGWKR